MIKIQLFESESPYVRIMKEISGTNPLPSSILCSIDLSSSSKPAIQWAIKIAQQLNVQLTILYTFRLLHYRNGEVLLLKKKMEDEAQEQFLSYEKELLIGKGISYDFKTEVGFVADRIEDHAKKNTLCFVVMNKNVSVNGKEIIDELIEHIHVPVLLVP